MTVKRGSRVPLMRSGRWWVRGAEGDLRDLVRLQGDRLYGIEDRWTRGVPLRKKGKMEDETCKRGCFAVSE